MLDDHLHLVVEAADRAALWRGLQGLAIRIAKALNRLWHRRGTVFADRYLDRIRRSPHDVRNALRHVLGSSQGSSQGNGKKHAAEGRVAQAIDTYTSAPWFDGFRETVAVRGIEAIPRPVTGARTRMLTTAWRRLGLLSVHDLPATD